VASIQVSERNADLLMKMALHELFNCITARTAC